MNRRRFLRHAGVACSALGFVQAAASASMSRRPNVLFVFADQMRSHVLGCYGNQQVATPHLDRLAEEGVRFTNALCTWPVCSPFRAMLLTGRYPMANGTVANDTAVRDDLPTIASVCKGNGYATGYIGKWHLEWERNPYVPVERRLGFDYWAVRNCSHEYFDSFYCGDTPDHLPLPGFEPFAQTDLAIDFMRRNREHPFCLFMSWGPPHGPYHAPEEYMRRFPPGEITLRGNVGERTVVDALLAADPTALTPDQVTARKNLRAHVDNDDALRKWIQGYYAATQSLDDCMGKLLVALDTLDIAENTILVFAADHGDMLGSHRMASKQMPYEESISIPFLLRYPRSVAPGTVSDVLLTPIDIMPTLLGLAGISIPGTLDGLDCSAAVRNERHDQRDAALIMKLMHGGNPWMANGIREWRGVRTKRHTYVRLLDGGPWLLFDNRDDPYQVHNLIHDPAHAETRKTLEARLQQLLAEAGDPGESGPITAFRERRQAEWRSSVRT